VLEYAAEHGVKPAAARFDLDRETIRAWRERARGGSGWIGSSLQRRRRIPDAVVDLITEARRDLHYGACRTRIRLMRIHQVKVAHRHDLAYLSRP